MYRYALGVTWSKQRPGGGRGGGGPGDEDDDDEDDDTSFGRVNDPRSRLARAFALDSAANIVIPPSAEDGYDDDGYDGLGVSLDIGLGVSLQAELEAQLERRKARLGDLRAAA